MKVAIHICKQEDVAFSSKTMLECPMFESQSPCSQVQPHVVHRRPCRNATSKNEILELGPKTI